MNDGSPPDIPADGAERARADGAEPAPADEAEHAQAGADDPPQTDERTRADEPTQAGPEARLELLRDRIQAVDEELIELVGRRRALVLEIAEVKAALGLPVMDPSQEARVVRRAAELARRLGVDEELTRDVIWRIMASARDAQEGRSRWGPPEPPEKPDDAETGA